MFKFTSNYYIVGALAVLACASIASAAPSSTELEARDTDLWPTITLCVDFNYGHCLTFPVADTCHSFVGGLSGYNQEVSSVMIPVGFTCTFFRNYACISAGTSDSVRLEGGNYPDFASLPGGGSGTTSNFNDGTSSVTCTHSGVI